MNADRIPELERLLLRDGCHFADDAKEVINFWESTNVLACPGSGKTTVLMAKLKILSDSMPLPQGRGVCILSHTNVAVDEIKRWLKGDAEKLLGYPNFAGTIQSFVDTFIVFPSLRSKVQNRIRVVSREEFAKEMWRRIVSVEAYAGLKGLLMNCFARSQGRFKSEMDLVAGLYVNDQGGLCLGNKLLAGSDKPTAKVFVGLFDRMFHVEGLLTYDSTYVHAFKMLEECGDLIRPAISQRFKYVFVDEYQDCSNAQRRLIDLLFEGTDTIVQRIGDLDQAIYNGVNAKLGSDWKVAGSCLEIAETNRYGNEIARVVSRLRTGQTEIISQRGSTGALPVLFVYPAGSEKDVVGAFVSEIRNANLVRSGTFKAIGMFRNGSGTKITDYWDAFSDDAVSVSRYGLEHYLQEIERQMDLGRLYNVSRLVVELLALVSRRYGIRTDAQRYYTKRQVRDVINEKAGRVFGEGVLKLATAYAAGPGHASRYILTLLCELCHIIYGGDWSEKTLFRGLSDSDGAVANRRPMVLQFDDGIRIQLNTVHGVKGETHDATLYLETQHQKSSDLRRIMPLFDGKTLPNGDIYERSRRCVYVGLSRPCQLLCVAMRADTYKGHEDSFANDWKVVLM